MFDTTVFDNLKVIVEGNIYDLDLEKLIVVTDRKDTIDLATMSRLYSITIAKEDNNKRYVTIDIKMSQKQLAGELLKTVKEPGCVVKLSFHEKGNGQEYDEILLKKLNKLWGQHIIKLFITKELTGSISHFSILYLVEFCTLFGERENDIEELLHIVDHAITLLQVNFED